MRKYPVTSRTWKSSSFAAKVVPGELGVRIARCTLYFYKKARRNSGFFFAKKCSDKNIAPTWSYNLYYLHFILTLLTI